MAETGNSLSGSVRAPVSGGDAVLAPQGCAHHTSTASGKGFSAHLTSFLMLFVFEQWTKTERSRVEASCTFVMGFEVPKPLVLLVGPCRGVESPSTVQGLRNSLGSGMQEARLCSWSSVPLLQYCDHKLPLSSNCGPVHNTDYLFVGIMLFTTAVRAL